VQRAFLRCGKDDSDETRLSCFLSTDADPETALGVVFPHNMMELERTSVHEFIAISTGAYYRTLRHQIRYMQGLTNLEPMNLEIDNGYFHKWEIRHLSRGTTDCYQFYNVLMIKRTGKCAERIGIGRIEAMHWERIAEREVHIVLS
jgi:hypothetical protein